MKTRKFNETDLKKQMKGYLTASGWFHFPILQGLGAYKGIPDLIAVRKRRVVFIEVKMPKGIQSVFQQRFQKSVEASGGTYLLVKSVDELDRLLGGVILRS